MPANDRFSPFQFNTEAMFSTSTSQKALEALLNFVCRQIRPGEKSAWRLWSCAWDGLSDFWILGPKSPDLGVPSHAPHDSNTAVVWYKNNSMPSKLQIYGLPESVSKNEKRNVIKLFSKHSVLTCWQRKVGRCQGRKTPSSAYQPRWSVVDTIWDKSLTWHQGF